MSSINQNNSFVLDTVSAPFSDKSLPVEITPPVTIVQNNIFTIGLLALTSRLEQLIKLGNLQFSNMQNTSDKISELMRASSELNTKILILSQKNNDTDPKESLPDSAKKCIETYVIEVNGVYEKNTDGIYEWNSNINLSSMKRGDLEACKSSIDNHSDRLSDTNSQEQLKIQKTMQNYNVATTTINSLQTMMTDMLKAIIQNIRA